MEKATEPEYLSKTEIIMARNTLAGKSTGKSKSAKFFRDNPEARKKKYIFTYQTKNLINGKTYVGVHTTYDLNDGYIGNGVYSSAHAESRRRGSSNPPAFVLAVCKYGYENFKTEILSFFDTEDDAYEEEEWIVNSQWVINGGNYNTCIGGRGVNRVSVHEHLMEEIYDLYAKGFRYKDIAYLFNCSISNVTTSLQNSILCGKERFKRRGVRFVGPTKCEVSRLKSLKNKTENQIIVFIGVGDILVFDTLKATAKYFNTSPDIIKKYITDKNLLNGAAIMRRKDFKTGIDYTVEYNNKVTKSYHTGEILEDIFGNRDVVLNAKHFAEKHGLSERCVANLLVGASPHGYAKHRAGWWYKPSSHKLEEDRLIYLSEIRSPDGVVFRLIDVYDQKVGLKTFSKDKGISALTLLKKVAMGNRKSYKGYTRCQ